MISSLVVLGLCLSGCCLVYLANRALYDMEENRCDMTYMFEYPEYVRVNLKKTLSKQFPRYSLYIYGEGEYAEELRNLKPTGIPVLFIPGNAGSYRQVRSFASVALRKAETKRYHFDYFTVDFNEDFSGLFGGVLVDQAKFVQSCLRHILRMYKGNKHSPDSVVVIGHSIGGLIARSLYSLDGFQSRTVHLIITLGTPHDVPIVPLDPALTSFYRKTNSIWQSDAVNDTTIVSVLGGSRDILVPVRYSSLSHISSVVLHHTAVATAVPHVWLPIDHLALCWCKQLVLVVNRALFDLIDKDTGQIMKANYFKSQALKYFGYLGNTPEQNNNKTLEIPIKFLPEISNNQNHDVGSLHVFQVSQTVLITRPKKENTHFVTLTKSVRNIKISSCMELENSSCIGIKDLSLQTVPIWHGTAEFLHVSADRLSEFSHLVVSPSKPELTPVLFAHFSSDNEKLFTNMNFFSSSETFLHTESLLINISLTMVRNNFDVFQIRVLKTNCKDENSGIFGGRVHIPWFNEDVYARYVTKNELGILLKVHTPKPKTVFAKYPYLQIWNANKCSLQVKVQYHFVQSMGQLFSIYIAEAPKCVYFWIATTITIQLKEMSNSGMWFDMWSRVMAKRLLEILPLFILVARETLDRLLMIFSETSTTPYLVLDGLRLHDWLFPVLFITFSSLQVVIFLHLFIKSMRFLSVWFLVLCTPKSNEKSSQSNAIFYCLFGLTVIGLSLLCSSLVFYFITVILFINNCKKVKEFKERVLHKTTTSSQEAFANNLRFCETLLLFYVIICFHSVPTFISWLKVLHYSWSLSSDPFFPLVPILSPIVALVLFVDELKLKPPKYLAYVVLLIWTVGFTFFSLDKLPFFLGVILAILCIFVFCKRTQHLKTY